MACLTLLGPVQLEGDDGSVLSLPAERRVRLLVLLGWRAGEWMDRGQLATRFYPDRPIAEARRNLRKVVHDLRELCGGSELQSTERSLRWNGNTDWAVLQRARAGNLPDAHALELWRGEPMAGLDDAADGEWTGWLRDERSQALAAWQQLAHRVLAATAAPAQREALARRLLAADQLDETAARALIHALQDQDRAVDAQRFLGGFAARVRDELGVEPSSSLLESAARPASPSRTAAAQPLRVGDGQAFVGRRLELQELRALLQRPACRLLTLTGPGGVGKSRLAREVLPSLVPAFPGGMHWIELVDAPGTAEVLARIASALRVTPDDRRDMLQVLGEAMPADRVLLVLDNAEHLRELPQLLQGLLRVGGEATLLVTSRHRLNIAEEWLLPLQGLAVPDADSRDQEAAQAFDAVQLFLRRAQTARRDFDAAAQWPRVVEIVERLGGLPLAIELAAQWLRVLPVAAIAAELGASLELLERGEQMPGRPARPEHVAMHDVLEHTWSLLAVAEREAIEAVAVFAGSFTAADARAVAGLSLPLLSSLVDKSLLCVDEQGRFATHPVVGSHAASRLAGWPDRAADLRRRHAEHFGRMLAEQVPHAYGNPRPWRAGLELELGNACAAWQYALRERRSDLLATLVQPLAWYHEHVGRIVEGIALLSPATLLPVEDAGAQRALLRASNVLAFLHERRGDYRIAESLARMAVDAADAAADPAAYVGCLIAIGLCREWAGRSGEATACLEQALAIARRYRERAAEARARGCLATALAAAGRSDEALEMSQAVLTQFREMGLLYSLAVQWINHGCIHRDRREPAAAMASFEQAGRLARENGFGWLLRYAQAMRSGQLVAAGRTTEARPLLEEVLVTARELGEDQLVVNCELSLARADLACRDVAGALRRVQLAAELADARDEPHDLAEAVAAAGDVHAASGRLDDAARAWLAARHAGVLEAAPLHELDERIAALPAPTAQAARAAAWTLHDVLAQLMQAQPAVQAG